MKIGFLGLCAFGLEYLKYLLKRKINVVFVTTKWAGGQLHITSLEKKCIKLCKDKKIPYLGSVDANSKEMIKKVNQTDIIIMGGYDKILKTKFLSAPKLGVTNTHLGLIPRHRGCYPVVWSILCDEIAGYTTYKVDERIDLGDIIDRQAIPIQVGETAKKLYDRLSMLAVEAFPRTLDKILKWSWPKVALKYKPKLYHKKGMPNDRWISWHWKGEFLLCFSRSLTFPPYDGPRTRIKNTNKDFQLYIDKWTPQKTQKAPGKIIKIKGNRLQISCSNGRVWCRLRNPKDKNLFKIKRGIFLDSVLGKTHPIPIKYSHNRLILKK